MTLKLNGTNSVAAPAYAGDDADTGLQCGTDELKLVTGGTARATVDSSGRLLVGTSSNIGPSADNRDTFIGVANNGAGLLLGRNDTAVTAGNNIGKIQFYGNDSNGTYEQVASITAQADLAHDTGDKPGRLVFATTADGASTPTERMRIDSSGKVGIGSTSPEFKFMVADAGYSGVEIKSDRTSASDNIGGLHFKTVSTSVAYIQSLVDGTLKFRNTSSLTERMRIQSGGAVLIGNSIINDNSNGEGILFTDGGFIRIGNATGSGSSTMAQFKTGSGNTEVLLFRCDGDIENQNNRYSGISDANLKENIVDAGSQWDDIKNIRVRKYNFRESTGYQTNTQIGVIAQEVELISPGLVKDAYDVAEDGSNLETTRKSVSYSVLYMKAVKALQEAMDRIETLEAKVAALEAAS